MKKLTLKDAFFHETNALKGWYYQLPDVEGGKSVIYAEVTGNHGKRVVGKYSRIYYVFEGEGKFVVNGEETIAKKGDVIIIPPLSTYSYLATKPILKLLLVMDLIDLSKLPSKK